jgi:hypothetical protein
MKVKVIIVDELPKSCEDCPFGHGKITDNEPCDLARNSAIKKDSCPLILEEDYTTLKDYY